MITEIFERRSNRKFLDKAIPKELVEEILEAAIKAPSPKNRQPWKFIIVSGNEKDIMLEAMEKGLSDEASGIGILNNSSKHLAAARYTAGIMKQVPVVVFVINTQGHSLFEELTPEEKVYEYANIQSIGAAIQNMSLTATNLGLGSLWICDIFFAYGELSKWLNSEGEMVGAMALGYADDQPKSRPRKHLCAVSEWRF